MLILKKNQYLMHIAKEAQKIATINCRIKVLLSAIQVD